MGMKKLEELALTTSDISAVLPKVIKKQVEEAREEKLYMLQLWRQDKSLVGKPGKSLHITKVSGTIGWAFLSEGEDIESALSAQERTFTDVEITPIKIGTWIQITREAIKSAQYNIVDMHIDRATFDLADGLDTYLYKTMVGATTTTESIAGSGTSTYSLSHGKILKVNSVKIGDTATTGYKIDYYDGKIKLAGTTSGTVTVSYVYSTFDNVYDASTTGRLTYTDFVKARTELLSKKWQPNVAIISPTLEGWLLKDERFTDASKYGSREVLLNGEIGKLAGLKIITTHNAYDVLVVVDSPKFGLVVWKEPLEVFTKEDEATYSVKIYFYEMVGAKVIWEDAVAIVTNTQSDAEDL